MGYFHFISMQGAELAQETRQALPQRVSLISPLPARLLLILSEEADEYDELSKLQLLCLVV